MRYSNTSDHIIEMTHKPSVRPTIMNPGAETWLTTENEENNVCSGAVLQ